ncbi:MAG: hypothetical protein OXF23_05200 [Candidatus Dadabacteria bacterium]|nr:hypothetical protein [Candidatus Dadabacteria bacterium]
MQPLEKKEGLTLSEALTYVAESEHKQSWGMSRKSSHSNLEIYITDCNITTTLEKISEGRTLDGSVFYLLGKKIVQFDNGYTDTAFKQMRMIIQRNDLKVEDLNANDWMLAKGLENLV